MCIVDRVTGEPKTEMMLWSDTRAAEYMSTIRERTTASFWRRKTLRDAPGAGLARLLWLKKHHRRLLNKRHMCVGAGEYVYFRLTGLWRQDAGNAIQLGCYNASRGRLDQDLYDLVGIPISFVAPMREGHEVHPLSPRAAKKLRLPDDVAVAGPYMDHEAGYLSSVDLCKRPLQCSLGTAWVGNLVLSGSERGRSTSQLVLPGLPSKGRLVVQPLGTGNIVWDWGLAQFADTDHARAVRKLKKIFSEQVLPPPGLMALPGFNRVNSFDRTTVGGGVFFGMVPQTTREDLLRALACSLVYEMTRVFEQVKETKMSDGVVLGGGASKAEFFRKMFAEAFAPLPVLALDDVDLSGARGALYALNPKVATAKAGRVPRPGKAFQRDFWAGYRQYQQLFKSTYGDSRTGTLTLSKRNAS